MCYTPPISFATACIEFFLAIYMRVRYKRARMVKFGSVFMMLLGGYQFTEFLLCTTPFTELWTKAGFVIYSFLPAVALHSILFQTRKKITPTSIAFIYAMPVIAVLTAMVPDVMVANGVCNTIFVTTHTFQATPIGALSFWAYSIYYAGFIIASAVMSFNAYLSARNKHERKLFVYYPVAVALMTVPTFIFIVLFPHFGFRFPSVLCHFALLLAAVVFTGIRREEQLLSNE